MSELNNMDHHVLHQDVLDEIEALDLKLAVLPNIVTEPFRPEDVTQDFVESLFSNVAVGIKLIAMSEVDMHEGATTRRTLKLEWNEAGRKAGLPGSVFAKGVRDVPLHLEGLAAQRMNMLEERFYQQVRPEIPDIAPEIFFVKAHLGGRYLIVMEDLTARGIRPRWMADSCSLDYARQVVTTQADLHARYWESDRFLGDLSWIRPRSARYGGRRNSSLFNGMRRRWLDSPHGQAMETPLRDLIQLWDRSCLDFYKYRDENRPHTLCHGDSHLGNTYEYPDGRAGFLDWQLLHRGLGLADVAYFVLSALDEGQRITSERALFDHYIDAMADKSVRLDRDQAWDDWCLALLYFLDCTITTLIVGTYGHNMDAMWRAHNATKAALLAHDVLGRLQSLMRKAV